MQVRRSSRYKMPGFFGKVERLDANCGAGFGNPILVMQIQAKALTLTASGLN